MFGQKVTVPNTPAGPYVSHFCPPLCFSHSLYSKITDIQILIFSICLCSVSLIFYIVYISFCFITSPHFEMLIFQEGSYYYPQTCKEIYWYVVSKPKITLSELFYKNQIGVDLGMYQYDIFFHDTMHTTKLTGADIGNISNHLVETQSREFQISAADRSWPWQWYFVLIHTAESKTPSSENAVCIPNIFWYSRTWKILGRFCVVA